MKPSRRRFLAAAPALIGLTAKAGRPIAGEFVNDAFPLGHRLRDHGRFAAPGRTEKVSIVIVGARHGRIKRGVALAQARIPRFRVAGDGTLRRRQLALG